MSTSENPRFGLQAHQVFWDERGSIVCACRHIPYPGSDTWVWERWEEITPEMMVEIDREGGHVACEGCGKEPRQIVRGTPTGRRGEMAKSKSTKKTARAEKPAVRKTEKKPQREDLCVFAFRLTAEERDAIHKTTGPGKASKFVRSLAVAAARNDDGAIKAIMDGVKSKK